MSLPISAKQPCTIWDNTTLSRLVHHCTEVGLVEGFLCVPECCNVYSAGSRTALTPKSNMYEESSSRFSQLTD